MNNKAKAAYSVCKVKIKLYHGHVQIWPYLLNADRRKVAGAPEWECGQFQEAAQTNYSNSADGVGF